MRFENRKAKTKSVVLGLALAILSVDGTGCLFGASSNAVAPSSLGTVGFVGNNDSGTSAGSPAPALNPANIAGTGSTAVPTSDAVVARIQKVLGPAGVNCGASGNCNKVLSSTATGVPPTLGQLAGVGVNLPSVANPLTATGVDQIPLVVYAACTDASPSYFGVNVNDSTPSNEQQNLINAGVQMVNGHVGNLAAGGSNATSAQQSLNTQVSAVFSTLVSADLSAGATLSMTFISVCLAANSFGIGMTGF